MTPTSPPTTHPRRQVDKFHHISPVTSDIQTPTLKNLHSNIQTRNEIHAIWNPSPRSKTNHFTHWHTDRDKKKDTHTLEKWAHSLTWGLYHHVRDQKNIVSRCEINYSSWVQVEYKETLEIYCGRTICKQRRRRFLQLQIKSSLVWNRLGQSSDLGSVGSRTCNTFCGDSLLLLGR